MKNESLSLEKEIKSSLNRFMDTEFVRLNIIKAIAGTNTPKGGDAGHGGKTLIVLENAGSTAWDVEIDGKLIKDPQKIVIALYGDSEAITIAEALLAIGNYLTTTIEENEKL